MCLEAEASNSCIDTSEIANRMQRAAWFLCSYSLFDFGSAETMEILPAILSIYIHPVPFSWDAGHFETIAIDGFKTSNSTELRTAMFGSKQYIL